jgi:hypothetical protein
LIYVNGYTIKNNIFIRKSDDPQIGFIGINKKISCVTISFAAPIEEEEIIAEIYFANTGEQLSEDKCSRIKIKRGITKAFLRILPPGGGGGGKKT